MPTIFRRMDTRRLHNPDIKQLVQVLRTDPQYTVDPGDACFEKATQAAIKKLPRRLRSSTISWHGSLCRSHKELDVYLINDVWSWIKYELGVAIGRFLYPIIMSDHLSKEDEYRVRQLEPVVRMFNTDWRLVESAAPGKRPIDAGNSLDEKPVITRHCLDDQTLAAFDISEPYHPDDWTLDFKHDPKIGPVPRLDPTTPTVIEGWDISPRGYDPLETSDEWLDKCIAPEDTMLRGYAFLEPSDDRQDDRRNTHRAKYRAPQPLDTNASRREAVLLEGDFRNGIVRHEGWVLPKPSRCSIYSKFGEEGEDGEVFEIVDVTPPPSPVGEELGEEMGSGDADADEGGSIPAPAPAPVPWYENPYGDCASAPLRLQK
ncbi:hypothetical protein N0V86_006646 [Didymella sp. IMI 355093]|nr:hypothetical protein N0V86_006646 [Didymella sp. IMI 355093]